MESTITSDNKNVAPNGTNSVEDNCKGDESVSPVVMEVDAPFSALRYKLRENPPVAVTLMAAFQHILLSISGCLTTSAVVADAACLPYDHPLRSHLFCSTLFMVGLCTVMQTGLGCRLPIFQGPSSSFLVPLLALHRDPDWACESTKYTGHGGHKMKSLTNSTLGANQTSTIEDVDGGFQRRLQVMSGSLMLASLAEVLMGSLGLLRFLLRLIGPITVACTIALIGISLYKLPIMYGRPSYPIAISCMFLVIIFVLYMKNVSIPLPRLCNKGKHDKRRRFYIFQLIPILLAVGIMWLVSWILTMCNVFTNDASDITYLARTDAKADVISSSKWLQVTYPGQFGAPKMSVALTLGFLIACLASMVESVGDYYAGQKACEGPRLADHAISRGIFVEGLGSVISGAVGVGHATTSYSGNIALLTLSKTASRIVMYTAGGILICVSHLGKAGAALTAIPNPVLGGVLMVLVGTLLAIGLSNLKHVDMMSSRNIIVVGFPLISGIIVPECLDMYPDIIQTGHSELDRILGILLGTPMFLGGVLALILDNTVPGTPESRGMVGEEHQAKSSCDKDSDLGDEVYSWSIYPKIARLFPCLRFVPFLPKVTGTHKALNLNSESSDLEATV